MLAVGERQGIENQGIENQGIENQGIENQGINTRKPLSVGTRESATRLQVPKSALALGLMLSLSALPGQAFERDGLKVNDQCSAAERTPEQPYNSRDSKADNGCYLCHDAGDAGLAGNGRIAFETGDLDFFCTLNLTNKAPEIGFVGPQHINVEQSLGILLKAEDGDGDNLHIYGVNLPRGAQVSDNGNGTAIFNWTPALDQAGKYRVTFLVSDSGSPTAMDSQQVLITVSDGNHPPLLAPLGNRVVEEGRELNMELFASDSDGDEIVFKHNDLPLGANFIDNGDGTALFSWTPGIGAEGAYPMTFTVSDGRDIDVETLVVLVTYTAANRSASVGSLTSTPLSMKPAPVDIAAAAETRGRR